MDIEEIQRRARSGPLFFLARRLFAVVISFTSTVTIARLLSPREFGLSAMSLVILSFMQVFRDFGLSNAVLRKGFVDNDEVNFLFWFNVCATLFIALALALASPMVADFYKEPQVKNIVLFSLIGFVIGGVSLQHNALLRRELRFDLVAGIEIVSLLLGFIAGLVTAIIRRDVWAIVVMNTTQSVTMAILNVAISKWMPSRPRWVKGARELFRFGANSSLFSLFNFVSRNSGTIVLGHFMGPAPLGSFNRAYALFQLPLNNLLQPIAQSALPVMTRFRAYPDLYAQTYLGLVERLSCALAPAGAILMVAGVPLVTALLGEKWQTAGAVLSVLAPSLVIYGLIWPTSDLLISQNRSSELRTSGIYDMVLRAGGTLVGVHFGLLGAAAGLSLGTIATTPIRVWQAGRTGPVSALDQYKACLASLPLTAGALVGSLAARQLVLQQGWGAAAAAAGIIVAGVVASLAVGVAVPQSRRALRELIQTLTGRYQINVKDGDMK